MAWGFVAAAFGAAGIGSGILGASSARKARKARQAAQIVQNNRQLRANFQQRLREEGRFQAATEFIGVENSSLQTVGATRQKANAQFESKINTKLGGLGALAASEDNKSSLFSALSNAAFTTSSLVTQFGSTFGGGDPGTSQNG